VTNRPAFTSTEYTKAFNDVRTCGSNSALLDAQCADPTTPADRNQISAFWQAEARTVREPGLWFLALDSLVDEEGTTSSLSDTARLYARVGLGLADAVRSSWSAKYQNAHWRPFHAIREADSDGNPATAQDATWEPRIFPSIGGSPEWNSGTSTFAGAASEVIGWFYFPKFNTTYCFDTYQPGPAGATLANAFGAPTTSLPRCYSRAGVTAKEAGRSRIFQGIHFQFSNENGAESGRRIGDYIAIARLGLSNPWRDWKHCRIN
jgi:hypothetical protein